MSNLAAAISQSQLMLPNQGIPLKTRSKMQVAKRVYTLAASGGFPYTGMSCQKWAKKWLSSDTFRLMEIDINAAASPHLPRNPERVAFRLLCSQDSMDPIVVDVNKQKTGKSHLGYVPDIVVLDGKHRKQAQMLQGRTRILAWVGCKAEKKLQNATVIDNLNFKTVAPLTGKSVIIQASQLHITAGQRERSPLNTAFNLHCATVPSTGQTIVDQSGGEAGSRPRGAVVKAKKNKLSAGGPGSGRHKEHWADVDPKLGTNYTINKDKTGWEHRGARQRLKELKEEEAKKGNPAYKMKSAGGGAGGGMGGPGASLGSGSGSNPMNIKSGGPGSGRKPGFEDWKKQVDFHIGKKVGGMTSDDLPDQPYADWHEQGVGPKSAASKAIRYAKGDGYDMEARDCDACGNAPHSEGQLDDASASDDPGKVPNASDQASSVSASDRRNYLFPKPNVVAPGKKGWEGYGPDSQNNQAPGSGSGPRTKRSTGATRSEMSRAADSVPIIKAVQVDAKGKIVKQIYTKAPPGREDQVLRLKKKYGEDSSMPFKIAWSQHNKGGK